MAKQRAKMPTSQRAKQFAPFDAVVGLRKALKEKEKIRIPKKELSEDMEKEIDTALKALETDCTVTVVYYDNQEENYIQLTGKFKNLNRKKKYIEIESSIIYFEDIYSIQIG